MSQCTVRNWPLWGGTRERNLSNAAMVRAFPACGPVIVGRAPRARRATPPRGSDGLALPDLFEQPDKGQTKL
jgi:hypothetical protein